MVFHKRSVGERADLERIVSENYTVLNLSEQEVTLVQSMAEHYLQEHYLQQGIAQGREQGARQMSIESTIATLNARFPHADVNVIKPMLEAIQDLDRLKALNLAASTANTCVAFREHLEA